jgi:CBS domain-containing protein
MRKLHTIFSKPVFSVHPPDTIAHGAELMQRHNVGALVVVEQHRPVGIVTDRDIALALGTRHATCETHIQEVMTCPVTTIRDDQGIYDATKFMMEHALRRVPVVNDRDRLVGLVTLDDLLILLSRELDHLARGVEAEVKAMA